MDSLNVNFPVSQEDEYGNYEWMSIRAGQDSSFSGNVEIKGDLLVSTINGESYTGGGGGGNFLPLDGNTPMDNNLTVPGTLNVNSINITGGVQYLERSGAQILNGSLAVTGEILSTGLLRLRPPAGGLISFESGTGPPRFVNLEETLDNSVKKDESSTITGSLEVQGGITTETIDGVTSINGEAYPPDGRYLKLENTNDTLVAAGLGANNKGLMEVNVSDVTGRAGFIFSGGLHGQGLTLKGGVGETTGGVSLDILAPTLPTYNAFPLFTGHYAEIDVIYPCGLPPLGAGVALWSEGADIIPSAIGDGGGVWGSYGLLKWSRDPVAGGTRFVAPIGGNNPLIVRQPAPGSFTNLTKGFVKAYNTRDGVKYTQGTGVLAEYQSVPALKYTTSYIIGDILFPLQEGDSIPLQIFQPGVYRIEVNLSIKNSNKQYEMADYAFKLIPIINDVEQVDELLLPDSDLKFIYHNIRYDGENPNFKLNALSKYGVNSDIDNFQNTHNFFYLRISKNNIDASPFRNASYPQPGGDGPEGAKCIQVEFKLQCYEQLTDDLVSQPIGPNVNEVHFMLKRCKVRAFKVSDSVNFDF